MKHLHAGHSAIRKTALSVLTTLAVLIQPALAQAHGIWFAQRSTHLGLIYGAGADDLDMVKRRDLITHYAAYDAAQAPVDSALQVTDYLVLAGVENQPAIVAAVMDNGTWSRTPEGEWLKKGRDEVPNATISEQNYKYAVHLRSPLAEPLQALPEHVLQIVPVDEILPDLIGAPMRIKVLHQGQPVAGAQVLTDFVNDTDAQVLTTGADGMLTIRIRNQGLNVLSAFLETPPENPAKTDRITHFATLSFVLPHLPE